VEQENIAASYLRGGEAFARETQAWLQCAGQPVAFGLGMPAGLALEGFELSAPCVVATIAAEGGTGGLFLVQTKEGEWYCPW
jgi:hypothetical protein